MALMSFVMSALEVETQMLRCFQGCGLPFVYSAFFSWVARHESDRALGETYDELFDLIKHNTKSPTKQEPIEMFRTWQIDYIKLANFTSL